MNFCKWCIALVACVDVEKCYQVTVNRPNLQFMKTNVILMAL